MKIELNRVIEYSKDCLRSRALMRAVILDLYPGATREMNVLLDVFESGVPDKIRRDGKITNDQYEQYVKSIIDEYGLQEAFVVDALNAWIVLWLGEDTLKNIHYQKNCNAGPLPGSGSSSAARFQHNQTAVAMPVLGNKSDFELCEVGKGYVIKKFLGFDQDDFVIPNTINSKRIVGIGLDVFKACKGIKKLTISEGIEYIEDGAFANCSNLQTLLLPSSLQRIGSRNSENTTTGAFENTAIREVDFPNGLYMIGQKAFYSCSQLEYIWMPDHLRTIGDWAFAHCSKLKEVKLPRTTKDLRDFVFYNCSSLYSIFLNEGLVEIGSGVFGHCEKIDKIRIPSTVKKIGYIAFERSQYRKPIQKPITLQCYPGSSAIEYARLNGLGVERA